MDISASLMCANQLMLLRDINQLLKEQIDLFHIDIIDGHFVNNFGLNLDLFDYLKDLTNVRLSVHLMATKPSLYFSKLIKHNVDSLVFHVECEEDIKENLTFLKQNSISAGLALNVETDIEDIFPYAHLVDSVLFMHSRTGYSSGSFSQDSISKVRKLKSYAQEHGYNINIISDGGVKSDHIPDLKDAGVSEIVGGTNLLFNENGISHNLNEARKLL